MKVVKKFFGRVEDGTLIIDAEKEFITHWKSFEGKKVELTIFKASKKRSTKSNSYYWVYLSIISDETGDDIDSLHEYFKRTLLPPQTIKAMGKEIQIPASTTKLSTVEMSEYIDRISALTGITAPDPNEYYN